MVVVCFFLFLLSDWSDESDWSDLSDRSDLIDYSSVS